MVPWREGIASKRAVLVTEIFSMLCYAYATLEMSRVNSESREHQKRTRRASGEW